MYIVKDKQNRDFTFRQIEKNDAVSLGEYFEGLSAETKSLFEPHPLTTIYAYELCSRTTDTAYRYILISNESDKICGYFILEYKMSPHEIERYKQQNVQLEPDKDVLLAPSIADNFQNQGPAAKVMPLLISEAKTKGARSLVLLGGTQEPNKLAIAFYEKFGFKRYGGFQTHVYNIDMMLEL